MPLGLMMLLELWKSIKLEGPSVFPTLSSHSLHTRLYSCHVVAPRTVMSSSKGLRYSPKRYESPIFTDLVDGSCIAFHNRNGRSISRWTWFLRSMKTTPSRVGWGLRSLTAKPVFELLMSEEEVYWEWGKIGPVVEAV